MDSKLDEKDKIIACKAKWEKPILLVLNYKKTLYGVETGIDGSSLGS